MQLTPVTESINVLIKLFSQSQILTFQINCIICLIESPLKVMKNAFYFILRAVFILKIFTFLSRRFGSKNVGKTA